MANDETLGEQKVDGGELARDVRLLGNALGDVLREQGGEALLERVERIRALTKEASNEPGEGAAFVNAADFLAIR